MIMIISIHKKDTLQIMVTNNNNNIINTKFEYKNIIQ